MTRRLPILLTNGFLSSYPRDQQLHAVTCPHNLNSAIPRGSQREEMQEISLKIRVQFISSQFQELIF
jgi:hypothetical protein